MFAIYDIQGRRFRDTLEILRKVRESQANQSIQSRPNLPEDQALQLADDGRGKTRNTAVSNKALQAYQEMRQLDRREPIYHAYQLMSCPVHTLPVELDILAARHRFQQLGFQQMPVLNTQQRIVGILSVQDLWLGAVPWWQTCCGCHVKRSDYLRSGFGYSPDCPGDAAVQTARCSDCR